jgi:tripartite-type tricarboxylate transporter receptor subunit TctC
MLKRELSFEAQDISYTAVGQAVIDTSTGKVDFFIANLPPTQGLIDAGKVRAIAVGSQQRLTSFPDVPTFAEITGRRDLKLALWYGVFAPAGTPASIVARLEKEIMSSANTTGVRARLAISGGAVSVGSAADLDRMVRQDNQSFNALITSLNLVTAK